VTVAPSVLITGANGFVAKNLALRLRDAGFSDIRAIDRQSASAELKAAVNGVDIVFHLAGSNRPPEPSEFMTVNRDFTRTLAEAVRESGSQPLIIFASSTKAVEDNEYGRSKRAAEDILLDLGRQGGAAVALCRLPNIFGKWGRPNYNSAVATFCHNIANGLEIEVHAPDAPLSLIYVDDLIDQWLALIDQHDRAVGFVEPQQVYATTVGAVADAIRGFHVGRANHVIADVGVGLNRALYATYVAALPEAAFSYPLVTHTDPRGSFAEMLKTQSAGQFSYFTAHPNVTRGGHYHHTKTEKFLIVNGEALFRFRHMLSGETHEVRTSAAVPVVVQTIPGWAHDVTNVGDDVMVSLLWANEVFDPARPDTIGSKV
jgi:UDP-2-acetamido-2,6-beta-L-arabino-hexul-4-ose reductase